jgi:hypothetical protein
VVSHLLSKQLNQSENQLAAAQKAISVAQLNVLKPANVVSILQPAGRPKVPTSPKPSSDATLALLVGLVLGVVVALSREAKDDVLRTREDFERLAAGRPAIGLIPSIREWEDRKTPLLIAVEQPRGPVAEAYRTLRTSLQFMSVDAPIKTLLITYFTDYKNGITIFL